MLRKNESTGKIGSDIENYRVKKGKILGLLINLSIKANWLLEFFS